MPGKYRNKKKYSVDKYQSKEIKTLKKKVKDLESPIERKFLDTDIDKALKASDATTSWNMVVNDVPPAKYAGSAASASESLSERMGKNITMNYLMIKGELYLNPKTPLGFPIQPVQDCKVRILVIKWKQRGINSPTGLLNPAFYLKPALYTGSNPPALGSVWIEAFKNRMPVYGYDIMYDKTHFLQSDISQTQIVTGTPTPPYTNTFRNIPTEPFRKRINIKLKLKGAEARWGDDETGTGPSFNSICVYALFDKTTAQIGAGTLQPPILRLNSRLLYVDQ